MTWRTPERVRRPSGEEAGRAWPRVRTGERGLAGPRDAEPIGGRIRGGSAGEACTENIGRTLSVCPMMAALATMVMGANCPWCRQAQRQAPDSQQSGSDVPSSVDTDTSEEVCRPVAACGATSLVVFASASWQGILPSGVRSEEHTRVSEG